MQSGFHHESEANDTDSLKPPTENPARNLYSGILNRSPGRDIFGKKGGKSIKDFTQDWINQYLSGQPRTERSNWLSDDSGSEAPSFFTAQNQFGDDDWLGLEEHTQEDLLRTPTLADFVGRRRLAGQSERGAGGSSSKDNKHKRNDTLRQEDFWGFAYDKDPQPISMLDTKDIPPPNNTEDKKATSPVDKPLPPPPSDAANGTPSTEAPGDSSNSKAAEKPSRESSVPTQRPRKKINWRGKTCFVALPLEDKRGSEESGYRLLTAADVEERLKEWEKEGYDIRGFNISTDEDPLATTDVGSLSRPPFPDMGETQEERQAGNFAVHFPNKQVWDAYVNELQEAKLRALGVDLGDDDDAKQPSVSPASASMSQMGPFPGLIASPPIPTASAAANPLAITHPFSPHLNQPATASNGVGSIASPASPFSVQTPLLGVDQNLLSRFPIQFQPTPPAQGSLTPQSFFNAQPAGAMPSIPNSVANLPSILSPVSPFNEQGAFHPGLSDGSGLSKGSFDNQFGHGMQDGHLGTQPMRPRTPMETNPPPDNFHASAVEIAHPTPRGHGHNVSETLQKGLDQFGQQDYHLEESIERQFNEHDREPNRHNLPSSDLFNSRWAMPEEGQGVQQGNQPFSYQNDGHEGSDFDTNPSLSGTPQGPFANHGPWGGPNQDTMDHQSKFSGSSFNAGAMESFSPQTLPFQGNAFALPGLAQPAYSFGAGSGFKPPLPPANSFNINAPSFTSDGLDNQKGAGQSDFKFSAPSFNVEAPVFNPNSSVNSTASAQESSGKAKIFGDVDLSQVSKPSKKSKAIPIVRPDDKERDENDNGNGAEDEGRRSTHADRHKRARRGDDRPDGEDSVRVPGQALSETHNVRVSQGSNMLHPPAEGKENATPDKDGHDITDAKTIAAADDKPEERKGTPDSEASTWAAQSEAKHGEEAGSVRVDSPVKHEGSEKEPEASVDKQPETEQLSSSQEQTKPTDRKEEAEYKPAEERPPLPKRASIFERMTKTFRFKPSVTEFVPSSRQSPKPDTQPAKKEQNDLMASRYAPKSPSPSAMPEPSPSERTQPEIEVKEPAQDAKTPQLERGSDNGAAEHSPNEEELNAIMEQLNDGSDVGIERQDTPLPANEPAEATKEARTEQRLAPTPARSEAPSPSPKRVQETSMLDVPRTVTDLDAQSQLVATPQKGYASGIHSPVRQLIHENDHISDWDDVIMSGEEDKLANRSRFFDRRINDLVGSAIDERLIPFERTLSTIEQSVMSMAEGSSKKLPLRSVSAEAEDSDADDEDEDDDVSYRTRSPLNQRDRKFDKLKSVILDALANHEPSHHTAENPAIAEIAQLRDSFAELQALTMQQLSHDPLPNMRAAIQDIVSAQFSKQNARPSDAEEIGADSLMLQIDGLKNMLRVADSRAEAEYRHRREAQDAVAELQRLLKVAETEAARHCEAAESAEARFLEFKAEKIPYFEKLQFQTDSLVGQHETLKLTLAELSSKNITLEGSLDEYRVSSDNWKRDLEEAKRDLESTKAENKELHDTIDHLRMRVEDNMSIRQNLTEKFDRLQDDMTTVQHDFTRDQAAWRKREDEHIAKYNELRAAYTREVTLREKLERDVSELEQQEREAAKLKFVFGQSQQENARLEELVASLRLANNDLEVKAGRFECEFNEARESSRVEIQRTRTSLESDLDAANNQVNIVRAELEAQIIRLQGQMDNVRLDADTQHARYEMLLEEAKESKANELAAATESKEISMDEQRKLHERVLNDLRERHARALHNSSEDRQRTESHLLDRLALSEEKAQHFQDRVNHLEEKLEITKSAARAAAEAAQSKGGANVSPMHSSSPSMSYAKGSSVPDKISPQALRESILVLQDQLQQREARIEELEQEVSSVDKDAPNKLKEKDTEITWLRELLGVRTDDLQDIVNTLSQPSFDQGAVRDAAIRLRANLQMQLQEKERALAGQSFPSLRSISELTASPRSLPMAAAAAIGNWRKGREHAGSNASEQTPSKPSNAGAFLSGLLTPPASSVRQTLNSSTPAPAGLRRSSESRPLKGQSSTPRPLSARGGSMFEPPKTPPLLRRANYDHDAEPANYEHGDFEEDGDSTADGLVAASPRQSAEEPFGPQLSGDQT